MLFPHHTPGVTPLLSPSVYSTLAFPPPTLYHLYRDYPPRCIINTDIRLIHLIIQYKI